MKHTLSVIVQNKPSVLARVTSLCSRRGFNIHSLAVGPIQEPDRSRITMVVDGDQMEAVSKQLNKLVNVIKVTEFAPEEAVEREIMLCRVNADTVMRPFGVTDLVKSGRIALARNGHGEHDGFETPRRMP